MVNMVPKMQYGCGTIRRLLLHLGNTKLDRKLCFMPPSHRCNGYMMIISVKYHMHSSSRPLNFET